MPFPWNTSVETFQKATKEIHRSPTPTPFVSAPRIPSIQPPKGLGETKLNPLGPSPSPRWGRAEVRGNVRAAKPENNTNNVLGQMLSVFILQSQRGLLKISPF